jgi:hypothetical protein
MEWSGTIILSVIELSVTVVFRGPQIIFLSSSSESEPSYKNTQEPGSGDKCQLSKCQQE